MDEIFTAQEAAASLKVSRMTIWRWCSEGKLPAFKLGQGWRIRRLDIDKMIEYELNGGSAIQEESIEEQSKHHPIEKSDESDN